MSDNLGIRLKNRTPDATSKVAADASIWDNITDLIEEAIENLTRHGLFEGLLTSPGLSVTDMVVSNETFQCVTADGVYCDLASGDVTHDAADDTNPRIDIICVNPTVRTSEGEIVATGTVEVIKGEAAAKPLVPDTPSNKLKIVEVDIPKEAVEVTLRDWKPMYVKIAMLKPLSQDTPGMTISVNFFRGYINSASLVEADAQDSPTFTEPAADKCRIDILTINSSGTLAITQGSEVDRPTEPSAPSYPTDKLVICEVFLQEGDTAIYQSQIKDVRPFWWLVFSAASIGFTPAGGVAASNVQAAIEEVDSEKLANVVEDTAPELGGDLNAKTKRIYDIKWLDFKTPTKLTIATGIITITQSFHTVDTESEAGSDDLVTISGGSVGRILILKAADDARTVVIKHGEDNIWLKGKEDVSLDDLEDGLILIYTAGSKWIDLGIGGAGAGATTLLELTDTPEAFDNGKFAKSSADALVFDEATIGFSFAIPIDTPETVGEDKGVFPFAPGIAGTIEEVYLMAKTAPGADKTLTVDIHKAGTTIFTTQGGRPSLVNTATEDTSDEPDVTTFAKNDKFTIDVDVSTAETAIADAIVIIRGKQKVV